MKKLISILLILCMLFPVAFASEFEKEFYENTKGRLSDKEIHKFVEEFYKNPAYKSVEHGYEELPASDYKPYLSWHEKGPKINLKKSLKKYEDMSFHLNIANIYIEDVYYYYPFYSIIINEVGVSYFNQYINDRIKNNTILTKKFVPSSDEEHALGTAYHTTRKIYAIVDENRKLKVLEVDTPFLIEPNDSLEKFKTQLDNYKGYIYKQHPKKGYKILEKYYYDQFIKAIKGKNVDKDLYFYFTY